MNQVIEILFIVRLYREDNIIWLSAKAEQESHCIIYKITILKDETVLAVLISKGARPCRKHINIIIIVKIK